jgi:hypothetical protein
MYVHIELTDGDNLRARVSQAKRKTRTADSMHDSAKAEMFSVAPGGYPCHHGMAHPRVADGRDGLQLEVSCEYIE